MTERETWKETMTRDRLAALAEAYGADPARWPEAERGAALRLIEADPAARGILADAAGLDGLLDAVRAPGASSGLAGRVLAAAPQPRGARLRLLMGGLMRPATGLAVAAILGVIAGTLMPFSLDTGAPASADQEIQTLIADTTLDLEVPLATGRRTDGSRTNGPRDGAR